MSVGEKIAKEIIAAYQGGSLRQRELCERHAAVAQGESPERPQFRQKKVVFLAGLEFVKLSANRRLLPQFGYSSSERCPFKTLDAPTLPAYATTRQAKGKVASKPSVNA
jgi:hypothetical protein